MKKYSALNIYLEIFPIILFFLFLSLLSTLIQAKDSKDYTWRAVSGLWAQYKTDSGNDAIRQILTFDRAEDNRAPVPFLSYRTLFLQRSMYLTNYATDMIFDYQNHGFYHFQGKLVLFFGGKSANDIYFIEISMNKQNFLTASLFHSTIIDEKLPARVAGNYEIKKLKDEHINIPLSGIKRIHLKRSASGTELLIDKKKVFSYQKGKDGPWTFYAQAFAAIGARGHNPIIDNFILAKNSRIIFRDDFSKLDLYQLILKVEKIESKSSGGILSPR